MNHDFDDDFEHLHKAYLIHTYDQPEGVMVVMPALLRNDTQISPTAKLVALYAFSRRGDEKMYVDEAADCARCDRPTVEAAFACLQAKGWVIWQPANEGDALGESGVWHVAGMTPFPPREIAKRSKPFGDARGDA